MGSDKEKPVSLFSATVIVVANMIGVGVFTTLGLQLLNLHSPATVLMTWILEGLGTFCGALCYGELGAMIPRSGGEYTYLSQIYHPAEAAGRMVKRIGPWKIETLLLNPHYRFYNPAKGGGIWLGSSFTRGGPNCPDPIKGLTQAATVYELCRFYYLLAYGKLISPERSRQMLRILAYPELDDKFVQVLKPEVPLRYLHRKSGQWRVWHSDSILVWGKEPWRRYILAGMVKDRQGERVLRGLVPVIEHLLQAHPQLAARLDGEKQALR